MWRERAAEIVRKAVPEKARSIFASFRPPAEPAVPSRALEKGTPQKSGTRDMQRGIQKYARAREDIDRMLGKQLPVLPRQKAALAKAQDALDSVRPHAGRDATAAFTREPALVAEAASGRTAKTIQAMRLEAEIRSNPEMRADRFVENWQRLHRQREQSFKLGDNARAGAVTSRMGTMAKSLERDPQVESLLRNRKIELGLRGSGSGIAHELTHSLGPGRGRGIGMGR